MNKKLIKWNRTEIQIRIDIYDRTVTEGEDREDDTTKGGKMVGEFFRLSFLFLLTLDT